MKIAILSRNPALYSTRRIAQAARVHGHQVQVVDTLTVPVSVDSQRRLPQFEAIIPRIGASITFFGLAVVRQFEAGGVLTTASSQAIASSRDKLKSLQIMGNAGLPIPKTTVVANPEDTWQAIELAGGLPVVIKLIRGTQGRGVFLAKKAGTVESILRVIQRHKEQVLIQEYISEAAGSDIRIIVVGNRCVTAMQRTAADGEFRSNLHRGGTARPFQLDIESRRLATAAARSHGLSVAGVDLIMSDRGPLVLEVNSSPGLEGIEGSTSVDVAGEIIRYLERESRLRDQKRRQKRNKRRK